MTNDNYNLDMSGPGGYGSRRERTVTLQSGLLRTWAPSLKMTSDWEGPPRAADPIPCWRMELYKKPEPSALERAAVAQTLHS